MLVIHKRIILILRTMAAKSYFVEQIAIPMATYSKETFLLKGLSLAKQNRFTCLTKVVLTM